MATPDITLYTHGTLNGVKASIVLEELGIPYKVKEVALVKAEQREPWYLKISPIGKIPAITDHSRGDFHVFESGAILLYLCEHYDPEEKLLPKDPDLRSQVIQWIMFHMGELGPTQGQCMYYINYSPEKVPQAIKRYTDETKRYYSVLNDALEGKEYLVGNRYTIADVINYPFVRGHIMSGFQNIDEFPNLKTWIARIDTRPATQKGLNVPVPDQIKEYVDNPEKLEEFGNAVRNAIIKSMESKEKK